MLKKCKTCKEEKEILEFNKDIKSKDKLRYECKVCQSEYRKKYYKQNKEKEQSQQQQYRKENKTELSLKAKTYQVSNKDRISDYQKQYRVDNEDKLREQKEEYYLDNIEYFKEKNKQYREDNPEKMRFHNANYRAAKLRATVKYADINEMSKFYEEAHRLTKETGIPHEVDHIIPLQGKNVSGLHVETNMQVITESENSKKNNKFE
jgi:hypothetical protein